MTKAELDSAFCKRLQELQRRCDQRQQLTCTDFLDAQTAALIQAQAAACFSGTHYLFSGGFADAERTVLFFLPEWQPVEYFDPQDHLQVLKIIPSDSSGLSHRDYLGSLMALGIKREKTGDILVLPDCAQLIVFPTLTAYLISNLTRIGRTSCTVIPISFEELIIPQRQTTVFTRTVASLRCDSVLSAAFGLSRAEATAAVQKGLVSVNHLPEDKPDRQLVSGCLLSIRGMGRVRMETDQTLSKKGRIFIQIIREG